MYVQTRTQPYSQRQTTPVMVALVRRPGLSRLHTAGSASSHLWPWRQQLGARQAGGGWVQGGRCTGASTGLNEPDQVSPGAQAQQGEHGGPVIRGRQQGTP